MGDSSANGVLPRSLPPVPNPRRHWLRYTAPRFLAARMSTTDDEALRKRPAARRAFGRQAAAQGPDHDDGLGPAARSAGGLAGSPGSGGGSGEARGRDGEALRGGLSAPQARALRIARGAAVSRRAVHGVRVRHPGHGWSETVLRRGGPGRYPRHRGFRQRGAARRRRAARDHRHRSRERPRGPRRGGFEERGLGRRGVDRPSAGVFRRGRGRGPRGRGGAAPRRCPEPGPRRRPARGPRHRPRDLRAERVLGAGHAPLRRFPGIATPPAGAPSSTSPEVPRAPR